MPTLDDATLAKLIATATERFRSGEFDQAETLCQEILAQFPTNFDAHHILGVVYESNGQLRSSYEFLAKAIEINPDHAEARKNHGMVKSRLIQQWIDTGLANHKAGRLDEAARIYRLVIEIDPNHPVVIHLLGAYEHQRGNNEKAIEYYASAVSIDPCYAVAYINFGISLYCMKRYEESLVKCAEGIRLKPDKAEAYFNHGNALVALMRNIEALVSYDKAIALKPDYSHAYNNRGIALRNLNLYEEALQSYDNAIALTPDYPEAHWNKSHTSLCLSDFHIGWKDFEFRWQCSDFPVMPRHSDRPKWLGKSDIQGKSIILWSEQGLGDTIQFCRYAKQVAELGATVYLEIEETNFSLLNRLPGVTQVFAIGDPLPDFDYQCPLLSLPLALNVELSSISGRPYLSAPAKKTWVGKIIQSSEAPRIGIAFSGRPTHTNDSKRSIPFAQFRTLLPDEVDAYCLQREFRDSDGDELAKHPKVILVDQYLQDFSDTAALINELDLVVTVDTSVAHLAGAMGKEVWILLPWVPDWRWLLDRNDSPWYDSATLFRQPRMGDWDSVLQQVKAKIVERYCKKT